MKSQLLIQKTRDYEYNDIKCAIEMGEIANVNGIWMCDDEFFHCESCNKKYIIEECDAEFINQCETCVENGKAEHMDQYKRSWG